MSSLLQQMQFDKKHTKRTQNKYTKKLKWLTWAISHLQKKGKLVDNTFFCGQGHFHLVGAHQIKIGNGCAFQSVVCSGCSSGRRVLEDLGVPITELDKPDERIVQSIEKPVKTITKLPCYLCQHFLVIIPLKCKEGDVVKTSTPLSFGLTPAQERKQWLKSFEPTVYLSD